VIKYNMFSRPVVIGCKSALDLKIARRYPYNDIINTIKVAGRSG